MQNPNSTRVSFPLLPSLSIKGLACATRRVKDIPSTHKTRKTKFSPRSRRFFSPSFGGHFLCADMGGFLSKLIWLVVSTHLKNISQIGNLPQIGVKIKNIWNHQPVIVQKGDCQLSEWYLCQKNCGIQKARFVMNCSLQHSLPTPKPADPPSSSQMGPGVSWSWVGVDWVDSLREWFFLHSQKLTWHWKIQHSKMHFLLKMGIFPMSS